MIDRIKQSNYINYKEDAYKCPELVNENTNDYLNENDKYLQFL